MRKILTILLFLCVPASGQLFMPKQKPMLGLQINRAHQLGDPIGLWLLNEGSGNKVFDLSGNGNTGIFSGNPIWVAGQSGPAIEFDGDDEIAITNILSGLGQFSVAFQLWADAAAGQTVGVLQFWLGSLQILIRGDAGNLQFFTATGSGTVGGNISTYAANEWNRFVATYDGSTMRMYKNGIVSATTLAQTGNLNSQTTLRIGGGSGSGSEYFLDGKLGDLTIYNRALSASEIALLYREPFCMFKRNPIISWYTETVIPPDWITITSSHYEDHCGDSFGHTIQEALDGDDFWDHFVNETHWFILDLGASYNIQKVRGRSLHTRDPTDANIYVHPTTKTEGGDWGVAVASTITTWQDTSSWVEIDTTDKEGRFVKVEIITTEDASHNLYFGESGAPYFTIFDVYGIATSTTRTRGQIIFINFF